MPCLLIEVPGNAHEDSVLGSAPVQGGVHHVEALESEIQKTSVSSEATFQFLKINLGLFFFSSFLSRKFVLKKKIVSL